MPPNQDLKRNPRINSYKIGPDYIEITFHDGLTHLYNHEVTGIGYIEYLKYAAETKGIDGLSKMLNNLRCQPVSVKQG